MAGRILLAKVGLDGHDRGLKVVARGLRDAGFHVIYGGIWQSSEAVAQAALDEDADWLGLSLLSGAHMTLVPRVIDELRRSGLDDVGVLLGGIVPEEDIPKLHDMGVAGVFGPGSSIETIAAFLERPPAVAHQPEPAELVERVANRDRRALCQLLSRIERGEISNEQLPAPDAAPAARTVAIAGSAGVGKSSLIGRLLSELRQRDCSVAVLACDPLSPITGGALLGDRIRMAERQPDPQILIRSLAVPSGSQGVAAHLGLMSRVLGLYGFDVVLIESVGIGQGDVAVRQVAGKVVLLLQPESGDSIQWEKAGVLEVADLIVIHKSDLPGADRLQSELEQHLNLPGYRAVPIVRISAARREGLDQLQEFVMS